MKQSFFYLFFLFTVGITASKGQEVSPQSEHLLWYSQPAEKWITALPLGNGRLGAMVFGDPVHDHLQLNDDSLWPHDKNWGNPKGTVKELNLVRQALLSGHAKRADSLLVANFLNLTVVRSHQTLGDLYMDWDHKKITDYRRSLDLNTAVTQTTYKTDGYEVRQKVFISNPNQLIVIHISSDHPDGLNGKIRLDRPQDNGVPTVVNSTKNNQLLMRGEVTQRTAKFRSKLDPILSGVKFETRIKPYHQSGTVKAIDNQLVVSNVKELTLYIASNSDYYQADYTEKNTRDLQQASEISLTELEGVHIKDYQSLYGRVHLNLNSETQLTKLNTLERLNRVKEGHIDNGLTQLLFDYGRYLLISSSRPGSLPANLQGLWNNKITAPWNADYHLNINLQMNYWFANSTGMPELNQPLFQLFDRLVENGKGTAQENFGARGTFISHATDIWGPTWLRAPTAYWGASFGAGGWVAQHYWNHYCYTQDQQFLKNQAFPAIEKITQFYSDWLIEDPRDHYLIATPSTSPENVYFNTAGDEVASCLGSAMDQQIIKEVFTNYLLASKALNIASPLQKKIKKQLKNLRPGFVLGSDGRVLEWDREYKEVNPGHRHMSHLYGFHPGTQVQKDEHPELFESIRKTLDYRLENGGAGPGWSRAWLINYSARLLDGEMAFNHIQLLFKNSVSNNLFTQHPPFQIDANFGFTAGVVEMLMQSHESKGIRLLPALPNHWSKGSISGLVARGNITIDMNWDRGQLQELRLQSKRDQKTSIIYKDQVYHFDLKKDQEITHHF